jgi:hypothetical protein
MALPSELVVAVVELERGREILREAARRLPEPRWRSAPSSGGFSLVEHAWHLADLEREGFGVRLKRILEEQEPFLPDFDGDRIARERDYASRALAPAIDAFAEARAANLAVFRSVEASAWSRSGTQEGVGRLTLLDLPRMMLEHDRSHAAEIADLLAEWKEG